MALARGASDIQVMEDVSYGPHARNVMDLYLPPAGPKPRPVVVCIHGGGWAGGDKQAFGWLAEALARQGFAAVSITYRFAPASRAPAQMDDVQRAVRWLRKHAAEYRLDPERIGAIGGSAGGRLASYLGVPIAQSVAFHEKLRQAGGQATLLKLEGAGHGFTGNGSNQYAQETLPAAVKFFRKHLAKPND